MARLKGVGYFLFTARFASRGCLFLYGSIWIAGLLILVGSILGCGLLRHVGPIWCSGLLQEAGYPQVYCILHSDNMRERIVTIYARYGWGDLARYSSSYSRYLARPDTGGKLLSGTKAVCIKRKSEGSIYRHSANCIQLQHSQEQRCSNELPQSGLAMRSSKQVSLCGIL